MRSLFLVVSWIAVSSVSSEEKLCNPVLEIQNTTFASVAFTWWCNSTVTSLLKGFELYFKSTKMDTFELVKSLDLEQHEVTLTNLYWPTKYEVFIKAVHRDSNANDPSETIGLQTLEPKPCNPSFEIKQIGFNSITLKWACSAKIPYPFLGYKMIFGSGEDDEFKNWKYVDLDHSQKEVTLEELNCGDEYKFSLLVKREVNDQVYEKYNELTAILGGLQIYPERNEVLEVDENSVTLKLDRLTPNCPVNALNVTLKQLLRDELIDQTHPDPAVKRVQFSGLTPNTEYDLHVRVNEGRTDAGISYTFRTLCEDEDLVAPRQQTLLQTHPRYFVVQLYKWKCVDSFAVEYRKSGSAHWNLVSSDTKLEQKSLLIQQLSPKVSYDVRITAKNKFRSTVAEYPTVQYTFPDGLDCDDWKSLGKRCVKFVKEAGLLSKNDAQLVCNRLKGSMEIPSLLKINNLDEEFDANYYFKSPGPIWLGLHSDDGKLFSWDDGAQLGYSNWVKYSPHNTYQCVQMLPYKVSERSWQKVNCSTWSYVACEKPKPLPSGELIEELLTTTEQLAKRLTEAETKMKAYEKNYLSLFKLVSL